MVKMQMVEKTAASSKNAASQENVDSEKKSGQTKILEKKLILEKARMVRRGSKTCWKKKEPRKGLGKWGFLFFCLIPHVFFPLLASHVLPTLPKIWRGWIRLLPRRLTKNASTFIREQLFIASWNTRLVFFLTYKRFLPFRCYQFLFLFWCPPSHSCWQFHRCFWRKDLYTRMGKSHFCNASFQTLEPLCSRSLQTPDTSSWDISWLYTDSSCRDRMPCRTFLESSYSRIPERRKSICNDFFRALIALWDTFCISWKSCALKFQL